MNEYGGGGRLNPNSKKLRLCHVCECKADMVMMGPGVPIFVLITMALGLAICEGRKSHKSKHRKNIDSMYDDFDSDFNDPPLKISLAGNLRKYFAVLSATSSPLKSSVCSPLSALLPLGKLALGATAKALVELLKTVGVSHLPELRQRFTSMIHSLQSLSGVNLDIASRIYVNGDVRVSETFLRETKKVFNSGVAQLDFSNTKEVVNIINKWVQKETSGKIKDLLTSSMISKETTMVLVNAIYFMGKWDQRFDEVRIGTFYSSMGEVKIPMMRNTGLYRYAHDKMIDSELIEIPYKNKKASFVIVLPRKKSGLTMLLSALKLAPEVLNKALRKMTYIRVDLSMPKFKIESTWDLGHNYRQLGMKEIFPGGEGMTLIQKKATTHVSAAVQKAFIEVDEDGTTAAAGSGLGIVPVSYVIPKVVNVDHPFLFFILCKGEQLFSGIFAGS